MSATARVALLAALFSTLFTLSPGPAHADRCEPAELVVRRIPGFENWEDPAHEEDSPLCYVLLNYVWPSICNNFQSPNGVFNCLGTLKPVDTWHAYLFNNFVWPFICGAPAGQTILEQARSCSNQINPNVNYRPTIVPYRPEPLRIVCDYFNYARAQAGDPPGTSPCYYGGSIWDDIPLR